LSRALYGEGSVPLVGAIAWIDAVQGDLGNNATGPICGVRSRAAS
jgi:hypothetical protein